MVFDEQRYVREVLEPARASGNQPPDDLRVRYALPDPLTIGGVAESVKRVRQCWRKSRGQLRFRRLIDRLEGDHLRLAPLFERVAAGDMEPLRAELAATQDKADRRRSAVRDRLLDAAGELKMLTLGEVREIGGPVADLAREAGIEIAEPYPLPTVPPYAGYPRARDALDALGMRHLREFITGEARAGRVLGPSTRDLWPSVRRVAEEWRRRPHDGNRTNADTVLIALKQTEHRLGELILYDVVTRLRERHQQRASERGLLEFAVGELGVDETDARRLVFAVRRENGPPGGLAARLRELIDGGEVYAAAELAAVAEPDELTGDAKILAAEARRRVGSATALRQEALGLVLSDPDEAWLRLADALRLVGDLPGAADLQARLAPGPPGRLEAVVDGAEVALSWSPTPSRVGEIGYTVVRCLSRIPRQPGDGEPLPCSGTSPDTSPDTSPNISPDTSPGTSSAASSGTSSGTPPAGPSAPWSAPSSATAARDAAPPVNAPVYYAVFAVRGGATSAPAVAGPVHLRPEPAGVSLRASDGVVAGRYTCPPEAVRVIVTRDGTPIPAERTGFRDETVRNGTTYHYRIAAAYLSPDGHETVTSGVHAAATPAARPDPVNELAVAHDPAGRLLVSYAEPPHGQVELVAMPGPPPWPPGTTVAMDEVRQTGRVLSATPVPGGVAVPAGPGVLVAVSVSGDVATIGAHREHVSLTPPRELVTERRGDLITLGFDWPADVTETEVRWRYGDGETRRLPVTRAGYDAHGGVRLAVPPDETVMIEVAAAATVQGERVTGLPVTAVVPGRLVVGYELRRPRLGVGSLQVTLTAPVHVRVRRIVLVARAGPMPQRSGDGETVMSWDEVSAPARLAAPMPRLPRPFWLRCFAEDETIELHDPPVRHLKVG